MTPSRVLETIASSEDSTMAARRARVTSASVDSSAARCVGARLPGFVTGASRLDNLPTSGSLRAVKRPERPPNGRGALLGVTPFRREQPPCHESRPYVRHAEGKEVL